MGVIEDIHKVLSAVHQYVKNIYTTVSQITDRLNVIIEILEDIRTIYERNGNNTSITVSEVARRFGGDEDRTLQKDEQIPEGIITSPLMIFRDQLLVQTQQLKNATIPLTDSRTKDHSFTTLDDNYFIHLMGRLEGKKNLSYLGDAYIFFHLYQINAALVAHRTSNAFICEIFKQYPLGYGSLESKADVVEATIGKALLEEFFPMEQIKMLFPASDKRLIESHEMFMAKIMPKFISGDFLSTNIKMKASARRGWDIK